jgi:aminoglycoside/choline kinase family phosphotransferase
MKESVTQYINDAFLKWKGELPESVESIAPAGSSRLYFRVLIAGGESFIATYNPLNIEENETFIYFSQHFRQLNLSVPEVLYVSESKDLYFQTEAGKEALMDILRHELHSEKVFEYYKTALSQLARIQILGHEGLEYTRTYGPQQFDKDAILYDLNYFLFYFLNTLGLSYDKTQLLDDFERLADFLSRETHQYFMFRDFQSRNIMVNDGKLTFIDYQGGMKGPLQYDVVSLLWQARAALPREWKNSLLDFYFEEVNRLVEKGIDKVAFYQNYDGFVLIRMLQTFGSYGFRGLFERRPYFLSAIPAALTQLKDFLEHTQIPVATNQLQKVLHEIASEKIRNKFEFPIATHESKLTVRIMSFAYKNGVPADSSKSGGGFVFDCRALHNPGRYEPYIELTGRDESVKQFLLTQSLMPAFLQNVYTIADISVQNYLERGFESLMICFGCTGGKHRSVFAADSLAKYLKDKYNVRIELEHRERGWDKEII